MSGATWLDYAVFGLTLAVAVGGLVKFILGRLDGLRGELRGETAELHERIDQIKDSYVRRDDFSSALGPIGVAHTEVMNELRLLRDRMHDVAGAVAGIQGRLERGRTGAE